jgi:Thaumatin family
MGDRRRRGPRTRWRWIGAVGAAALLIGVALVQINRGGSGDDGAAASAVVSAPASGGSGPAAAPPGASGGTSASPSPSADPSASPTHKVTPSAGSVSHGAAAPAPAGSRTFTFVNRVDQTIWLGAGEQTAKPALATTGWVLPAGQSLSVTVPDTWNGRFWGRTGCTFNASGTGHCQTGDCGGKFQCPGYGAIPATLAEFNLNSWDNLDFYDVSMVDGSNLPMWINTTSGATKDPINADGCSAAGCATPVVCPAALVVDGGSGCESACGVFGTDQYCCRGQWAPRSMCDPAKWPVDYAAVFKKAEPYAYSYSDDDATSTFTCTGECDYRITFGVSP